MIMKDCLNGTQKVNLIMRGMITKYSAKEILDECIRLNALEEMNEKKKSVFIYEQGYLRKKTTV